MTRVVRGALAVLPFTLFLYAVATLSSMAGMEIFSWLSAAVVIFVLLWQIPLKKEDRLPLTIVPAIDLALVGIILVVAIGAALAEPGGAGFVTIIGRVRWILLFFFIRTGLSWIWSERFSMILSFLIGLCMVIAIYSIIQHFTGIDILRDSQRAVIPFTYALGSRIAYRVSGLLDSPMTWAHAAAMFVCYPAALFFLRARRYTGYHWWLAASVVLIGLSVILTFTRGAWISTAIALLIVGLYAGRRAVGLAVLGLAVVGGIIYGISPNVRARIALTFDPNYTSNIERMNIWNANIQMYKDHPLVGVGYGENERLIGTYYERMGITDSLKGHAHSTYFQWLSGTGALGFTLFMVFILGMLWMSHRLWMMIPRERLEDRALVLGAIGSQVAMHVGGLTECNFKDAEVNHQFMFTLAMVWTLYHIYASEHHLRIVRPKSDRGLHQGAV